MGGWRTGKENMMAIGRKSDDVFDSPAPRVVQ
jgi:hypothetical protein